MMTIFNMVLKTGRLVKWAVFANGQANQGAIPGRVIPKNEKMVLDTSLLITQHYKVCIKDKVDHSRERNSEERVRVCVFC